MTHYDTSGLDENDDYDDDGNVDDDNDGVDNEGDDGADDDLFCMCKQILSFKKWFSKKTINT